MRKTLKKTREIRVLRGNPFVDTCATRAQEGKETGKHPTHAPYSLTLHTYAHSHTYTRNTQNIPETKMENTRWRWSLANADAIRGKK